jgi:ankyrin repeat protein
VLAVRFGRLELALLLLQSGAKAAKGNSVRAGALALPLRMVCAAPWQAPAAMSRARPHARAMMRLRARAEAWRRVALRPKQEGVTALHEAAKRPFAGGVQVLLRGIQPKQLREALIAHDKHGRTPLHYAAVANRGEAVTALAKAGADVNATTAKLRTPLHAAAYVGADAAMAALLAAGASHAARDDAGDTPLHDAASVAQAGVLVGFTITTNAADMAIVSMMVQPTIAGYRG